MDLRYHVWLEESQTVVAAFEQSANEPFGLTPPLVE